MTTGRAYRAQAPPGGGSMAGYLKRTGARSGFNNQKQSPEDSLLHEQPAPRKLRLQALRSLKYLLQHGGEIPPDGAKGVLLPPLPAHFFGDELGCLPGQAQALLNELVEDGILVLDNDRFRVPNLKALDG